MKEHLQISHVEQFTEFPSDLPERADDFEPETLVELQAGQAVAIPAYGVGVVDLVIRDSASGAQAVEQVARPRRCLTAVGGLPEQSQARLKLGENADDVRPFEILHGLVVAMEGPRAEKSSFEKHWFKTLSISLKKSDAALNLLNSSRHFALRHPMSRALPPLSPRTPVCSSDCGREPAFQLAEPPPIADNPSMKIDV
ncbi:MAG: hypothetical protein RIC55_31740 [Pirellulaceae bacterium]